MNIAFRLSNLISFLPAVFLSFALSVCLSSWAQAAYYVVPVTSANLNKFQRTHIVVSGRGNDLKDSLQKASAAKIQMISKVFPKDQILYITTEETSEKVDVEVLNSLGLNKFPIERNSELLDLNKLMEELQPYYQISSLHVFSHSGVIRGMFLDRSGQTDLSWEPNIDAPKALIGHFTQDAFAALNGCNTGHVQGPSLARVWGIPVAASLTATHFQTLFQDNYFYAADAKLSGSMANCKGKPCYRMRPYHVPYKGLWGHHQQGLPFYKFFCPGIDNERCWKSMAASMATNISQFNLGPQMNYPEYLKLVQEWMCPSGSFGSSLQKKCMETLAQTDLGAPLHTYTPFNGPSSRCTMKSCYTKSSCEIPFKHLCARDLPEGPESTSFVDEYISYLQAFKHFSRLVEHQ